MGIYALPQPVRTQSALGVTNQEEEKEKRLDDEYCGYYQAVILDAVESEKDAWECEREYQKTYQDLNRRAAAGIR